MKLAPLLLASLLPFVICACEKKEPAEAPPVYGDPVGVKMEASADVPAFEVAIAVTKGIAIDPLVPPLGGLLHKALRACPDFVKVAAANPDAPTQVAFAVEQGKTKDANATVKGAECVTASLSAKELPGLTIEPEKTAESQAKGAVPGKIHVIALVRFLGASPQGAQGRTP